MGAAQCVDECCRRIAIDIFPAGHDHRARFAQTGQPHVGNKLPPCARNQRLLWPVGTYHDAIPVLAHAGQPKHLHGDAEFERVDAVVGKHGDDGARSSVDHESSKVLRRQPSI